MKIGRAIGIAAALAAGALGACWPFEEEFEKCRADGGNCVGRLLDAGGCPTGQVAAGYCLMEAHRNSLELPYIAVWGLAPDDVYLGGWDVNVSHYDGTSYTDGRAAIYAYRTEDIVGFAGTAPDDIWAIGGYYLAHRDSLAWSYLPESWYIRARAGHSIARGQVVTGGRDGIYRWTADDPNAPAAEHLDPAVEVRDVLGFGPGRVYAIGYNATDGGYLLHRESDAGWSQELIPIDSPWAMAGPNEDDLWVVGESGAAIHRTGGAWKQVPTGASEWLYSAWVSSDGGEVWFTGDVDHVFHRMADGGVRPFTLPGAAGLTLYDVWGFDNGDLWVAGFEATCSSCYDAGYALRYRAVNE